MRSAVVYLLFAIFYPLIASGQQVTIKPYDLNKDSVVLTNGMVATTNKATRCGEITMYNSSASTVYLLVYDLSTNSVPAAGRAPTLPAIPVPANSVGYWDWNVAGRKFQNGVIAAASTTPVTFTNAGNVAWFTVTYDGFPN